MEGKIFVFWNWTVALYLFVAGVSAGAFAISAISYFLGRNKYENISRLGAYIAPFPLLFGILCLIYDLERPAYFWKLMVTIQPFSVMSLGAWLLLIFSFLSFVHFYIWLPERFDLWKSFQNLSSRWSRNPLIRALQQSPLLFRLRRENLDSLHDWVALIGIPVSLFVGIYTGVLLGALVARPFWNNPMLPMDRFDRDDIRARQRNAQGESRVLRMPELIEEKDLILVAAHEECLRCLTGSGPRLDERKQEFLGINTYDEEGDGLHIIGLVAQNGYDEREI